MAVSTSGRADDAFVEVGCDGVAVVVAVAFED